MKEARFLDDSNSYDTSCPKALFTSLFSGWTPLGRGSDRRFGLRRFRAKLTPTAFGTHRAFTHALPPSFGSALSLSPFRLVSSRCRSSEERNKPETAEREKQ
jgi:hypothetical protein